MSGAFISSWLRMMFSARTARPQIDPSQWALPDSTASSTNGRRGGVAHAKRQSLKAKRRKAHRMHCK